jgi:ketosteroid isomerase-like protein
MYRLAIVAVMCLSVIFLCSSCMTNDLEGKVDKENERVAIEKTIHNVFAWAKTKDFKLLYSCLAGDADYLEVDPGPGVIKGIDQFKKNEKFWASPDFKAVKYEIRDLEIRLSESGTVAWFYCIIDDVNEWKGQPASWMNTRWTGVLEKRKGNWVVVQMHFSFASS